MKFAEVAVNAPGGYRHTFTYSIPESLTIQAGQGVRVPFGPRVAQGIVVKLADNSPVAETRDIIDLITPYVVVSAERIKLASWIADYYMCPIFHAVALMLPPGFESGKQVKPKYLNYLVLDTDNAALLHATEKPGKVRAAKQVEILQLLEGAGGKLPVAQLLRRANCGRSVIRALLGKKLVAEVSEVIKRDPLARRDLSLEFPLQFTDTQQQAWVFIESSIEGKAENGCPRAFLLHGVTGSGKTEIYLQALAETIRKGKKGICLVPEISLTPQIIDRFFARFPGRVAVLHSKLSFGEQYDEWQRISSGEFDIVIGPRSAIFAPQPDLGLIIVDEEHEWSYKQSDKMPRYHARDVAIQLAKLTGAVLILGSATPDIETYYFAKRARFQLVELQERVTPLGQSSPLPEVDIVNMRDEFKAGNRGIFSRLLKSQVVTALERHEQVIMFINRRGRATFVKCRDCGYVLSCRKCSGALTYHAASRRMICHHCRRSYAVVSKCPVCAGQEIKYLGVGTETVEIECRKLFPSAKVIRFDSDAVSNTKSYTKIIESFRRREADIMVGTQILAKGLDFPAVFVVGVVSADTSLNLPDFRSGERTFQLLCQVAGRAGRGIATGHAVIQTFNPGYYAIKFAAGHDYKGFYESEIKYRRDFGYPPFNHMARLVYSHAKEDHSYLEAERIANVVRQEIAARGLSGLKLIGPAPAYIQRLRGKFQVQVIILGQELQYLLRTIDLPAGWVLDVDPVGMI